MPTLKEIRSQFPQYDDLSDAALSDALYKKFYSDMPRDEFNQKIGSTVSMMPSTPPPVSPRQAEDQSMAAYEKYKNGPDALIQSLPKPIRQAKEALRDSVTGIGQGLTFNFGDEAQAAMATPLEMLRQGSLDVGKAYDSALGNARREQKIAEMRSPIANTVGQVAGGMAAGGAAQQGGLTLLNGAKIPLLDGSSRFLPNLSVPTSMALRGAGEGAAYGGLYGAGAGEGGADRLDKAMVGGGLGLLTGGAMGAWAGRSAQKAADKTIPSAQVLARDADAAYKAVDQSGITISPKSFDTMVDDIAVAAKGAKLNDKLHPDSSAALDVLVSAKGSSPTISEVDQFRQILGEAAASQKPGDKRIASLMIDKLDDFVSKLKPSDTLGAADPIRAVSDLNRARDLYSMRKKADLVAKAFNSADLRAASTGSGGNVDNAIRQNIRGLLESPRSRGFTKEERDLLEKVVRGGPVQNALRLVGKLSPSGNGLMAALGIGGTVMNPAAALVPATGMAAKTTADAMTRKTVDQLSRVIRSGGNLPVPTMLPAQQRALLEAVNVSSPQLRGLLD